MKALSVFLLGISLSTAAMTPPLVVCLRGLLPNLGMAKRTEITRTVRKLGLAGGPYEHKEVTFPYSGYFDDELIGKLPPLKGFEGKTGFVFDATSSGEPIGPGNAYEGNQHGTREVQQAIQAYVKTKDFKDGTLDIFIQVRTGETLPNPDLHRIYQIVSTFGSQRGAEFRNGPETEGMGRNPEHRRNVRIFVLAEPAMPSAEQVPIEIFYEAASIAKEFQIHVAVTARYVGIGAQGNVRTAGSEAWALFYQARPRK